MERFVKKRRLEGPGDDFSRLTDGLWAVDVTAGRKNVLACTHGMYIFNSRKAKTLNPADKGETKWMGDISTRESGYLKHVAWEKLFSPDLRYAIENRKMMRWIVQPEVAHEQCMLTVRKSVFVCFAIVPNKRGPGIFWG